MTRAEQYSLLLRVEYGFWNKYLRNYQEDRLTRDEAIRKMDVERNAIIHAKQECERILLKDEYPEEYYFDTPEPAEQLIRETTGAEPPKEPAVAVPPDQNNQEVKAEAVQLTLFDIFGNI